MAIKIITAEEEVSPESRWFGVFLVFSIIFFLIVFIFYFFIVGSIERTKKNIEDLKSKFLAKTEEERKLEESIISYQQKIKDFSFLLNNHKKTSNFFEILEDLTHPQVWFSNFKFNSEGIIGLEGQAESYEAVSQQLKIFQENPNFQEVKLEDVSLIGPNQIKFRLSAFIRPEVLLK